MVVQKSFRFVVDQRTGILKDVQDQDLRLRGCTIIKSRIGMDIAPRARTGLGISIGTRISTGSVSSSTDYMIYKTADLVRQPCRQCDRQFSNACSAPPTLNSTLYNERLQYLLFLTCQYQLFSPKHLNNDQGNNQICPDCGSDIVNYGL
jgi:hypothetical protein